MNATAIRTAPAAATKPPATRRRTIWNSLLPRGPCPRPSTWPPPTRPQPVCVGPGAGSRGDGPGPRGLRSRPGRGRGWVRCSGSRMVARGVVTAVLSVLLVGCGGGGATEPFGSAATVSVTTSLTAAAHASDAALSIYAAWGRGDLETARFYATTEVADFLLNHPFPGDAFAFTGCLPSPECQGREVG